MKVSGLGDTQRAKPSFTHAVETHLALENNQLQLLHGGGIIGDVFSVNPFKSQIFPVKNSYLQISGLVAKSSIFKTKQFCSLLSPHLRF